MFVKYSPVPFILVVVALLSTCTLLASDSEKAHQALVEFFEQLSEGNYAEATERYGGSYEVLVSYNPELDPDKPVPLWRNGCQINGFQCLDIRIANFNELNAKGEYIFTVQFNNPDGSMFLLGECCTTEPSAPPQFQFEYRVVKGGDGVFRVLDMPVYVP